MICVVCVIRASAPAPCLLSQHIIMTRGGVPEDLRLLAAITLKNVADNLWVKKAQGTE